MVPKTEDIFFFEDSDGPKIDDLDVEIDDVEVGEEVDIYCIIEGIRPKPEDDEVTLEISKCISQ